MSSARSMVKDSAGHIRKAEVSELGRADGTDLSAWAGASSGLLDEADLGQLATEASSVHGRVQRRQQQRWAAQDQAAAAATAPVVPAQAPAAPHQAPAAAAPDPSDRLAQLSQLGDLKNSGVLTEAEFEREKARILNG